MKIRIRQSIVRDSQMLHRLLKVQSEENPGLEVFRKVFTANTSENAESWVIHSDSEESSKRILNQVSKVRSRTGRPAWSMTQIIIFLRYA